MTLRKLPLEGTQLEFDINIIAGTQPEFLWEVSVKNTSELAFHSWDCFKRIQVILYH